MRRVLIGVLAYLAGLLDATRRGWDAFFFRPADPTPLGALRVAVGLLLTWNLAVLGFDLQGYLGSGGWADPTLVQQFYRGFAPRAWSFWFWVPDRGLWPTWLACLVVLGLYTVGLFSRITAPLAWVIAVSTARRMPMALFGFDQIVETLALYLAVTGASGQAISVDHFLARLKGARAEVARRRKDGRWTLPSGRPEPTVSANLALRLVQLHMALIYGMAGLAKLRGEPWWDGTALWGVIAAGEFRVFDLTWLVDYPVVLNALTHASLAFEILYPVLIWSPRIRPLLLLMATALHLGIALSLGLWEFALVMLAGNLAFVSGPWLRSLFTDPDRVPDRLVYDGSSPRVRSLVAFLVAGDPGRSFEPVEAPAAEPGTFRLTRATGPGSEGFPAARALAWRAPGFWAAAALGMLPGLSQGLRGLYHRSLGGPSRSLGPAPHAPAAVPPVDPATAPGRRPR